MIDTTDAQTVFPLNEAQNEGIMQDVERLSRLVDPLLEHGRREELAAALRCGKEAGRAV